MGPRKGRIDVSAQTLRVAQAAAYNLESTRVYGADKTPVKCHRRPWWCRGGLKLSRTTMRRHTSAQAGDSAYQSGDGRLPAGSRAAGPAPPWEPPSVSRGKGACPLFCPGLKRGTVPFRGLSPESRAPSRSLAPAGIPRCRPGQEEGGAGAQLCAGSGVSAGTTSVSSVAGGA